LMADPASTPHTSFSISPANADLNLEASCQFFADPPETEVTWTLAPHIGEIDKGVYTSPKQLRMPQTVIVVATSKSGSRATAVVNIADVRKSILWLGWYAIIFGAVVAAGILLTWTYLNQFESASHVIVNPVLVTMDPGEDESFTFVATVLGTSSDAVTWSAEGGGDMDSKGTYRRKIDRGPHVDKMITITAKSVAFPSKSGTAIIHLLSGKHLEIEPQPTAVFPAQQVPFRALTGKVAWSVSRSDLAKISPDGVFTAGTPQRPPSVVQITAWGGDGSRAAVSTVIGTDRAGKGSSVFVLLFVILCGTLGSMIYFSSSFVSYVGNQTFRSSWTWFYISRPFVGGALALIFFFIIGSGLISGTSTGELMKIGMVSALVGLFSDKAIKKLSDVLDVLFATTKDDRKDKVTGPATTGSGTPRRPEIASFNPPVIPHNAATTVEVHGANFLSGYKVKVNQQDVNPVAVSEQMFKVDIPANEAKPPSVAITVVTEQGSATSKLKVE
jgi:hypothetical protein